MKRQLDPRTKIFLLLAANMLLFLKGGLELTFIFMGLIMLMLLLSGCFKTIGVFIIIILITAFLNYIVLPAAPLIFTSLFAISVNYTFKMLPCLMAGAYLIRTTSLHDVILAMRKCRIPQQLIIPVSITIRYFPALFEEIGHIRNAMKLKKIPASEKAECFIVPLMMAATSTAEELSAAAVTRGIENPARKTSIARLRLQWPDYLIMAIGIGFVAAAFML